MWRRSLGVCLFLAGVLLAAWTFAARSTSSLSSAAGFARPAITEFISSVSGVPSPISADGRYVVFVRDPMVFVRDRVTGATEKVSVASDGTEANEECASPVISADGRYVAYWSVASNLVPDDTNGTADVFVHDRVTHATERVSLGATGNQLSACLGPAISGDGRYVTFWTDFPNVVPGDTNGAWDIFVRDRVAGTTERVSVSSSGGESNSFSFGPSISADGRYVGFMSAASNLVPNDTNSSWDTFLHDRVTGITERISVAFDGREANGFSYIPAISADGRYVAFESGANNLVPGATRGGDVFVRDRVAGTLERVSLSSDGTEGDGFSSTPYISNDGRYVAFYSHATTLVPNDTNGAVDVFLHDRTTKLTERISVATDGGQANSDSYVPAISDDGRFVAFQSYARLVAGNPDGVFVRDRGGAIGVLGPLSVSSSQSGLAVSGKATFSGTVISSAIDSSNDSVAGPLGATPDSELTGASVIYRPEKGDLLVRLRGVTAMMGTVNCVANTNFVTVCQQGGGAPGVFFPREAYRRTLYGVDFQLDGVAYEVRARAGSTFTVHAASSDIGVNETETYVDPPYLGVYRCDPTCTEQAVLTGGRGTAGPEFWTSVPLSALSANEGAMLTSVHAFTAIEETDVQPRSVIDDVVLPNATIPIRTVSLGVAPFTTPESGVVFNTPTSLLAADFSGTIAMSAGEKLWARACLGAECGPAISWSPAVELTGVASRKTHGDAGTYDVDLANGGVECRSGGANGDYKVVFTFADALTNIGRAAIASGTGSITNAAIGSNAHEYVVDLTDVTSAQTFTIGLTNVNDNAGNLSASVSATMRVLTGDTTGDGVVNSADIAQTKSQSGRSVTNSNFREDLNTDGALNSADISLVKSKSGTALP